MFLSIKDLSVSIDNKKILNNFSLEINKGEVHAIMGPNGCGKSTLSNVLAGKEDYEILAGSIYFKDQDLLKLNIEERAQIGIFLAFQYPIEIPGVNITPFLKASLNSKLKKEGKPEIDALSFAKELKKTAKELGIKPKRYEILQMSILKPSLAILDETDSGLDVDAFKTVTKGVNNIKNDQNSFLLITHYQKLLDYIVPDYIHVMKDGKIIKTGDKSIAQEIEKNGYNNY